ncbi:DUF1540 domain-containing protein [Hathewaya histolytica]|uniref:DUF1540 domain-containing protein n=1 Tax=Hathewaya histolytica TaxID=1498 RepID=UPI003B6701CC
MKHNESIKCVVDECKYHSGNENYCTLNVIEVVKHEPQAKTTMCTDCGSFEAK